MPAPNPPGFYPFWFWNDRLTESEIRWQIAQMAQQGIRGFFIHPRQGLQQPYLSNAFFDMVAVAIDAAEQNGLLVHLYDEYPYPSGIAGGEVTEGNPHFQATRLLQRTLEVSGGLVQLTLPQGNVLTCIACPVENGLANWHQTLDLRNAIGMVLAHESYNVAGLTQYNQKRYFASQPTPVLETVLPDSPHRIFVSIQAQVTTHKYWGYYVDVLNPDAVQHYIRLTHERYYARFADKFGTTIRSIFVDETFPDWSARLPDAFKSMYGYDLLPLLPALQDATHPEHVKITQDMRNLRYHMFVETYDKPMAAWCAKHNIAYSGEKSSMRLSQLQYMHIPGCDPGHTKAGAKELDNLTGNARRSAKATASAAYFYNKEGALDECYHSLGWSGTIQDAKFIADTLILMGVKYLVPHGFFYSTHALKKHDAPPTFFFQMPYWPHWGQLSKHIEVLYNYFDGTHIPAQILLVDHDTVFPTRNDVDTDDRLRTLLMENHLDFLIVDTDILESGHVENGRVYIRDIAAKLVMVPPGRFIEEPLANWLAQFEKQGGHVLHVKNSDESSRLQQQILAWVQPHLGIKTKTGDLKKLQMVTRTDGKNTFWFLINTGSTSLDLTVNHPVFEMPLGKTHTPQLHNNTRTLSAFESILLKASETSDTSPQNPHITIPIRGDVSITPKNKNLARLYNWQMSLLNETGDILQTETVPAVPMANQLSQGHFRFAPNIHMQFGIMPRLGLPRIRVRYTHTFERIYPGPVELIMEPGSIVGDWYIRLNDGAPIISTAFSQTETHVRGSLGLNITPYLKSGSNKLTVDLITDRLDGGLRNPLYLAGDFGVHINPLRLTDRLSIGHFETYESNGLPFYAGVMEYKTVFTCDQVPEGDHITAHLDFGMCFLEACEIAVNNTAWQPLLWSPYVFTLPRETFQVGANTLKIRVYTSLIRSFEGQRFDHETHSYQNIE